MQKFQCFFIYVVAIMYLLLCNLHDCTVRSFSNAYIHLLVIITQFRFTCGKGNCGKTKSLQVFVHDCTLACLWYRPFTEGFLENRLQWHRYHLSYILRDGHSFSTSVPVYIYLKIICKAQLCRIFFCCFQNVAHFYNKSVKKQ